MFQRIPGVLVEPVGHVWVSYSPASGETCLLNDESAAVLEVLDLQRGMSLSMVCEALSADSGTEVGDIRQAMVTVWVRLVDAGLIRQSPTEITSLS